jgi:hypothetical protein
LLVRERRSQFDSGHSGHIEIGKDATGREAFALADEGQGVDEGQAPDSERIQKEPGGIEN